MPVFEYAPIAYSRRAECRSVIENPGLTLRSTASGSLDNGAPTCRATVEWIFHGHHRVSRDLLAAKPASVKRLVALESQFVSRTVLCSSLPSPFVGIRIYLRISQGLQLILHIREFQISGGSDASAYGSADPVLRPGEQLFGTNPDRSADGFIVAGKPLGASEVSAGQVGLQGLGGDVRCRSATRARSYAPRRRSMLLSAVPIRPSRRSQRV